MQRMFYFAIIKNDGSLAPTVRSKLHIPNLTLPLPSAHIYIAPTRYYAFLIIKLSITIHPRTVG